MIGMRMRQQDCVELRKLAEGDTWCTDPRKETRQLGVEIRIGKNPHASHLDEERRMTDVRYTHISSSGA